LFAVDCTFRNDEVGATFKHAAGHLGAFDFEIQANDLTTSTTATTTATATTATGAASGGAATGRCGTGRRRCRRCRRSGFPLTCKTLSVNGSRHQTKNGERRKKPRLHSLLLMRIRKCRSL
jgi:hypothetical protein